MAVESRLFLALSLLVCFSPYVYSQTIVANCSNNTWITLTSSKVVGATLYPAANGSVAACRSQCINQTNPNCTGFDFDGANNCWISTTSTPPTNDTTGTFTHYSLLRGINSCTGANKPNAAACTDKGPATFNESQNIHVNGGSFVNSNVSFRDCIAICESNASCTGVDWDATVVFPNCWIVANQNPHQSAPGVNHFDKICGSGGFLTINPIPISGSGALTEADVTGLAIQPAYIVLIGLGGGCILLVIIAVFVLCTYPMKGRRSVKRRSATSNNRKSGLLRESRPKTLLPEEISMKTRESRERAGTYDSESQNGTIERNGSLDRTRLVESPYDSTVANRYGKVSDNMPEERSAIKHPSIARNAAAMERYSAINAGGDSSVNSTLEKNGYNDRVEYNPDPEPIEENNRNSMEQENAYNRTSSIQESPYNRTAARIEEDNPYNRSSAPEEENRFSAAPPMEDTYNKSSGGDEENRFSAAPVDDTYNRSSGGENRFSAAPVDDTYNRSSGGENRFSAAPVDDTYNRSSGGENRFSAAPVEDTYNRSSGGDGDNRFSAAPMEDNYNRSSVPEDENPYNRSSAPIGDEESPYNRASETPVADENPYNRDSSPPMDSYYRDSAPPMEDDTYNRASENIDPPEDPEPENNDYNANQEEEYHADDNPRESQNFDDRGDNVDDEYQ